MIKYFVTFFLAVLLLAGCFQKEEKTSIVKKGGEEQKIEDTELKNWMKTLEEKSYKIDVSKLKNPFIAPETLKAFSEKKEKIPLELVGVLEKKGEKMALLEDNNKKGYIVKVGNKIGNIKILKIGKDYVIVEEEETNIYGEKEVRKRVLPLKKEKMP